MKTHTRIRCGFYIGRGTGTNRSKGRSLGAAQAFATQGCFIAGTRLRLADQSEIAVEHVKGDEVFARPDRTAARSLGGRAGPEVPPVLFLSTASGHHLGVTRTHPMVVQRAHTLEVLAAADLRVGDLLLVHTPAGLTPTPVTSLDWRVYHGRGYNLRIAGHVPHEHFVVANGIVTGDLHLQGEVEAAMDTEVSAEALLA